MPQCRTDFKVLYEEGSVSYLLVQWYMRQIHIPEWDQRLIEQIRLSSIPQLVGTRCRTVDTAHHIRLHDIIHIRHPPVLRKQIRITV